MPPSDLPGEVAAATQPFSTELAPFARQDFTADEAWGLTFWDRGRCRAAVEALRNEGLFTPASLRGSMLIPSSAGGANWGAAAFDPQRQILIVNNTNLAFSSRLIEREKFDLELARQRYATVGMMPDTPYVWMEAPIMSPFGVPCTPPPWGAITAYDMTAGEILWQIPFGRMPVGPFRTPRAWGAPHMGGAIITAGGLIFIGASLDSRLRAYSLADGEQVWEAELPAPGVATPMTYSAGEPARQYVVIAAGGHARLSSQLSDALVAFALPAAH